MCTLGAELVCFCIQGPGFVDISPTLVIGSYINRKMFTSISVLQHWKFETQKVKFKKIFEIVEIEFCPLQNVTRVSVPRHNPRIRNHPGCVDVTSTLVINALIERSSRVLQHGNTKILKIFQKSSKLNFDLCRKAEITLAWSISVLH